MAGQGEPFDDAAQSAPDFEVDSALVGKGSNSGLANAARQGCSPSPPKMGHTEKSRATGPVLAPMRIPCAGCDALRLCHGCAYADGFPIRLSAYPPLAFCLWIKLFEMGLSVFVWPRQLGIVWRQSSVAG